MRLLRNVLALALCGKPQADYLAHARWFVRPFSFARLAVVALGALYTYVVEHLGNPEGVVVLDETGFPKKGGHLAGGPAVLRYAGQGGQPLGGDLPGPTPAPAATRCWTGNCTCRGLGPATRPACRRWAWPRTRPLPPSRPWRGCGPPACP